MKIYVSVPCVQFWNTKKASDTLEWKEQVGFDLPCERSESNQAALQE